MTNILRAAAALLAALCCLVAGPAHADPQPLAGIWGDNGGVARVIAGRPFAATFKLLDANGVAQDLTGRAFVLSFRPTRAIAPVVTPVLATASGQTVTLSYSATDATTIAAALRSQAGQMELDDATDGTPVRVLALPVLVYQSTDLIGTGPPSGDTPTSTVTISANAALTSIQQTGARGLSSIDAGEPKSIISYGGYTGAADNAAAFTAAAGSGSPTYLPLGIWRVSALPPGLYYGPGQIQLTGTGEIIPLDLATPQLVNTAIGNNGTDRRLNFAAGQGAGGALTTLAQANILVGNLAGQLDQLGDRNLFAGWSAGQSAVAPSQSIMLGDSAGKFATYMDRDVCIAANACKWMGDASPSLAQGYDYLDQLWGQLPAYNALWPGWMAYLTVDGTQTGAILGNLIPQNNGDAQYNVAIGRDALNKCLKCTGNTVIGTHSAKGLNNQYLTLVGDQADQFGLINDHTVAIGALDLQSKMSGANDAGLGYMTAPLLVHGYDNLLGGSMSLPLFNGDSLDQGTVNLRAYGNVLWGTNGGALLKRGAQNAIVGYNFSSSAYWLDNDAGLGTAPWANVYATFNSSALGYRAGQNNRSTLLTASASGNVLTVTFAAGATLQIGDNIRCDCLPNGTKITAIMTGSGGVGTYALSQAVVTDVPSQSMVVGLYNSNSIGNQVGGLTKDNTQKVGQQQDDTTISGRTYTSWKIVAKNASSAQTLTANGLLQAVITRTGLTAALTDTFDTAANIIAQMPSAEVNTNAGTATGVGTAFDCYILNSSSFTETLAAGAGDTLLGTPTIAPGAVRHFKGIVTSIATPAVTIFALN